MEKIWSSIYRIIIDKEYTDAELSSIVSEWNNILECSTDIGQNRDSIIRAIERQIRILQDKIEKEDDKRLLVKSLRVLECPGKCSINDLNNLLRENQIFYQYKVEGMDKVFISHSSKDEKYVNAFVELLEDIGIQPNNFFCTSTARYGVPLGEDIFESIRRQFTLYNTYVIFLLSNNYYSSPACMNEMGAAWVLQKKYTSVILPELDDERIKGTINIEKMAIKLDEDKENLEFRLEEFKNKLEEAFSIQKLDERIWKRRLAEFFKKIE